MADIRRLADSCVIVGGDDGARTLFDPGFATFESGKIDLDSIGAVDRLLITHEHADHAHPGFVRWLVDRSTDLTVYANEAVAALLVGHDIEVSTAIPDGVLSEDVTHEVIPTGAAPPNRSFTIQGVFTHPGDSYQPTMTAPVLALPLMAPWGSTTASVAFARKLAPQHVVPIHDFYLIDSGRDWLVSLASRVLAADGIELVPLGWGESFSF